MANIQDHQEEQTRVAGQPYQCRVAPDATRLAIDGSPLTQVGYQSVLLTQLGALTQPETPPERYKIGDKIGGRFEVFHLHRGSMGIVYATFDHRERLPRALKTLQQRFASSKNMRDLFAEEAAVWVRLEKHPFIVRAYFVERYDQQPYVITEYIRGSQGMGSDLRGWLGHPKLTLPLAVEMALQIAQGMQHATLKVPGLVHRDLKPANVLVDERGRAMVTDFGLVYAAETDAGTPAYMAPEQWRGESIDERADIYAYGCILYEMLTGHRTYAAESIEQWKAAHLGRTPAPLRALNKTIPVELEAFVYRCLSKDAATRPDRWDEVVQELARWFHQLTGQPAVLDFSVYELTAAELITASRSLFHLGKHKENLEVCERVLSVDPSNSVAWTNKSAALCGLKRHQEAITASNRALEINPNDAYACQNKGAALNDLNRYEEAIAAFDRAIELEPTLAHAWNSKGIAFRNLNRYEEAFAAYDRAIELDPHNAFPWCNRGLAFQKLKMHEEAVAAYKRAVEIDPNEANFWIKLANAFTGLKRYEEALAANDRAIEINPDDAAAWSNKGAALLDLERYEESMAANDRAIEIDPDDALAWSNKGTALLDLNRYEEALGAYDRAVGINADYADAWNNKGSALMKLKRYEEATTAYDRAIKINPDHAVAWNNMAQALRDMKRYEEAIAGYDRALGINPDDATAWINKGVALMKLKRHEEALTAYDRAIEIDADYGLAWFNKGSALHYLKRYEEAIAAYDRALQIDPHDESARTNRTLDQRASEFIQPISRRKSTWEKITGWFFERFS
jgi:tetratricopeptide (TPR) repeat protein